MFQSMRSRLLVAGLLVGAVGGGFSASAQAATRTAGSEDVTIPGANFDFGGKTFTDGAPAEPGSLEWLMVDGIPKPRLTGYIHMKHAKNSCAYMQILYLNSSNAVTHT